MHGVGGSPAAQLVNATLASFACPIYRVVLRVSDGSINGKALWKVRILWHGCHICRDHCEALRRKFPSLRTRYLLFRGYFLFLISYFSIVLANTHVVLRPRISWSTLAVFSFIDFYSFS